jgi:DNA recombination protein RmuC
MENFEIASYLLGLISGAFISSLLILIIYLLFIKKDETSSEEYLTDILDKFTGDEGEYLLQILNKTKDQATLVENLEERFDAFSKGLSSIGGQGQLAEINLEKIFENAGLSKQHVLDLNQAIPGTLKRPDFLIRMPKKKTIVIDAKNPFEGFQQLNEAIEKKDESNEKNYGIKFSTNVIDRVIELEDRKYHEELQNIGESTPRHEFMYLPLDNMKVLAEKYYPLLQKEERMPSRYKKLKNGKKAKSLDMLALDKGIHIVTPNTCVAVISMIRLFWEESASNDDINKVKKIVIETWRLVLKMFEETVKLRTPINNAREGFNKIMKHYEPILKKLEELKSSQGEMKQKIIQEAGLIQDDKIASYRKTPEIPSNLKDDPTTNKEE